MKAALIHICFTLIFLLCGNRFIKPMRYSKQVLYREYVTTEGVTLLRVMPNNALQPLFIHDTAHPLETY